MPKSLTLAELRKNERQPHKKLSCFGHYLIIFHKQHFFVLFPASAGAWLIAHGGIDGLIHYKTTKIVIGSAFVKTANLSFSVIPLSSCFKAVNFLKSLQNLKNYGAHFSKR